ncbi:hypothetical protein EYC80_010912 [Monilinia laxa]|uniref:Uncharacterized protein n=1 Tax=Monilinia laxa TaxID=61186 RepID=A0A5N6JPJ3_MONLA|nr:hypothetical protein EYC80_010912 [Monilinia laxa]
MVAPDAPRCPGLEAAEKIARNKDRRGTSGGTVNQLLIFQLSILDLSRGSWYYERKFGGRYGGGGLDLYDMVVDNQNI